MESLTEITLPSGRILKIQLAEFTVSKELYQVFAEEMKGLKIEGNQAVDYNFFKDIGCTALSSKKLEKAVYECMKRSLIDDLKIDNKSFEKEEHRDDYLTVLFEVAKVNIKPFTKSLYAQFGHLISMVTNENPK